MESRIPASTASRQLRQGGHALGPSAPLVAGLMAVLSASTLAQEEQPSELPAGPAQGSRVIELSVEDAVVMALGNNIGLERTRLQTDIAEFDALGSWGQFEWVFNANVTASRAQEQGTNNFDGGQGNEIENDRLDMLLGFTRPVTTGGQFDISFNRVLTRTDNPIFADRDPNNPGQFLPFDDIDFTRDRLSLNYVQPFLRGAWKEAVTSSQQEAELFQQQQREVQRQTRQNLVLDVETRYWDLIAAQLQLRVAEESLGLGQRQLERERTKLEAGVGTEVEVVQAESEVATRRETLIQRQTAVGQAEDDLRVLLFSPDDLLAGNGIWLMPIQLTTALPDEEEVESMNVQVAMEMLETALDHRSDLLQQEYAIEIARVRHKRTLTDRQSQLDLTLSVSSGGFDENDARALDNTLNFDFPTYSASLAYSTPLGNKTRGFAERSARTRIQQEQLTFSELRTQVASDLRRALRDVVFRSEAVQAARQSLLFAQRQLDAEQAKYDEGLSTLFQVFEFQQTLTEAESSLSNARVEYAKARVNLINAQGLTGETAP